jgi:glycosyltransferase involved in cell wall biosynthesis
MAKLVAMLRVKDGILFINSWLKNISPLVDEIVVVDNGSTDGTLEVLQKHSKVVSIDRTVNFHEGRDKNLAYKRVKERKAEWVLWMDVDEIFEERLTRAKLEKMMSSKFITKYFFRRFHFHKDFEHFEGRLDKLICISKPDRVLWKDQHAGYFRDLKIHNGLICGIKGAKWISKIRIKHYGQLHKEYLGKKTNTYITVDPERTEMYLRHRDQKLPTWKWYEFREKPIRVIFQSIFFDLLFLYSYFYLKY